MRWIWTLALSCCAVNLGTGGKGNETTLEALSVGDARSDDGCSTAIVRGLTEQLVAEAACIEPDVLRSIDRHDVNLGTGARTAPYLQRDAAMALERAVTRMGRPITIQSALRSLPQQFLLYEWHQRGVCGIRAAAQPGRSNHETGLAIDLPSADVAAWRSALEAEGFVWFGSGDPVHFDYRGAGSVTRVSVLAFQRLWNRNHPGDRIAEDGVYGSQTQARVRQAPAEGFPEGASCGETMDGGDVCSAGVACADCNAIAYHCGFCGASGQCMTGDGDGPFAGSCAGSWQWVDPSSCEAGDDLPPLPEPEPLPSDDPCASFAASCGLCTDESRSCGYCADSGTCASGDQLGPLEGSCGDWTWLPSDCGGDVPPDPVGSSLSSVHAGLTISGHEIPRRGLANPYLMTESTEPYGEVVTYDGLSFVRGTISHFGGPHDTGVTSTETGAITGERLRSLNSPDPGSATDVRNRPADYYFVAMRWRYLGGSDLAWWRTARVVVVNQRNGSAVVLRPVDWGPNTRTRRIVDVSPQAMVDLGVTTDDNVLVAFVDASTPLGPIGATSTGGGCGEVRTMCSSDATCCGDLSCRMGATFEQRCCAEAGSACASGADCCGSMGCFDGTCGCQDSGRNCVDDRDCCTGWCDGGTCL
jgi:hypothetical protein